KLVFFQSDTQASSQQFALFNDLQHDDIKSTSSAAPLLLCCVERDIRGFHQGFGIRAVNRCNRNTNTEANKNRNSVDREGLFECMDEGVPKFPGALALVRAVCDDGEFIACQTVGQLVACQTVSNPVRG